MENEEQLGGNTEEKRREKYLQYAMDILRYGFKFEEITNNEYLRLRFYIEDCMRESRSINLFSAEHFNVPDEAVARYLSDTYDIPFAYDPLLNIMMGYSDKLFIAWLNKQREQDR